MASLLRSQLVLQLANAGAVVLAMVWVLRVSHALPASDAGAFFAALAVATMAQTVTGALRGAHGRRCAWLRDDPGAVTAATLDAERTLLRPLAIVGALGLPLLVALGSAPTIAAAVVAAVATRVLAEHCRAALSGLGEHGRVARSQLLEAMLRLVLGAVALVWIRDPAIAILAYAWASAIAWRHARRSLPPRAAVSAAVSSAWHPLPALIAWSVVVALGQHIDVAWVSAATPHEDSAAYGAIATLLRGFALVALPIQLQLTPQLTAGFARGHFDARTFATLCGAYVVLAAIPLAAGALWPAELVTLACGKALVATGTPLVLPLTVGAALCHLGITIAGIMVARERFAFVWAYGAAMLLRAIAIVIATRTSAEGAAHAGWIGHAVGVIVLGIAAHRCARRVGDAVRTPDAPAPVERAPAPSRPRAAGDRRSPCRRATSGA